MNAAGSWLSLSSPSLFLSVAGGKTGCVGKAEDGNHPGDEESDLDDEGSKDSRLTGDDKEPVGEAGDDSAVGWIALIKSMMLKHLLFESFCVNLF